MIIPVVIGAIFLGRAFDYYSLSPKPYQIFDRNEVIENKVYDLRKVTVYSYNVVESNADALSIFDLDPAISLKAMNGDIGLVGGIGNLIQVRDRSNIVEIMILYTITDGIESFPTSVKLGKGWQDRSQRDVGTHYIKAIEYGGQLAISVQFRVNNQEDVEEVRRLVKDKIGSGGSGAFFDQLEALTPLLVDKTALTLSVYSNGIGTISPPTKLEDLRVLVDQFPALVEEVNGGKGAPLRLHLEDLHNVQSNRTEFKVSREVENLLPEIQEMYEDIRIAVGRFRTWDGQGHIWTQEQEEQIQEYLRRLKTANRAMSNAIHKLDITGSTSQFDEALKAYDYDGEEKYKRYTRELQVLMKNIEGNSLFRTIYSSLLAMQEESRPYRTQ